MKTRNMLLKCISFAGLLTAIPAQATLIINYVGTSTNVPGGDQSGLTSQFVPVSNTNLPFGYFIETFDTATQMPGFDPGSTLYNVSNKSAGCAVNTMAANSGVAISMSSKSLGVQKGSTGGVAAAPAGDSTCFAFIPGVNANGGSNGASESDPAWIEIDYAGLLSSFPGVGINYLGFYFGSVDTYNKLEFFNGDDLFRTVLGSELLNENGGSTGNQTAPGSNVYVNLFFQNQSFTKFRFTTTGVAAEFDNIVVGLNSRQVSEPAGLAVLGLGLAGLFFRRRMKKN
jgi:hypothetical protein